MSAAVLIAGSGEIGARTWLAAYRRRERVFPGLCEGRWRILLTLLVDGECSVTSAALASGGAATTGLRHLRQLENDGLVVSRPHPRDQRGRLLSLSASGRRLVEVAA